MKQKHCCAVCKRNQDVDDLIAEVERLRIDLEHAENERDRVSYEARYALERYGQHRAACKRLMDAQQPCSCGLDRALEMLPATLPDLIRQIEARGWQWEAGCNQVPHEPDRRYYAYLWLPTLDPMHEDCADEREGWGASVEDALRQAIAALPPDPYKK